MSYRCVWGGAALERSSDPEVLEELIEVWSLTELDETRLENVWMEVLSDFIFSVHLYFSIKPQTYKQTEQDFKIQF